MFLDDLASPFNRLAITTKALQLGIMAPIPALLSLDIQNRLVR